MQTDMSSKNQTVLTAINQMPRAEILEGPTPLVRLHRLSEMLDVDLWMKRDDLAGPSFGGNKARQLEYYFGAAIAEDADTILITGAVQSNFVRLAAAVAVRYGMKAIIQLEQRVSTDDKLYHQSGNVLLNHILGAEIMSYPVGEDESGADDALYARVDALRAEGRKPYVIPLGENKPPLGACGYVQAAAELKEQMPEPFDTIAVASGSAATHIGVVAGMKIFFPETCVIGSCVRRSRDLQETRLANLLVKFNDLVGCPGFLTGDDFRLWDDALAPGYGKLGPIARDAMMMMARNEGYILDPVYTAKSFAAVPEGIKSGEIKKGSRVLYINTGGLGGLFAYQTELAGMVAG